MLAVISSIVHSERSVIHLLYFSINNAALHPYLALAHNALLLQYINNSDVLLLVFNLTNKLELF